MSNITRFEIKKLHGYKNLDIPLNDNTLILVGENGAGKTTILHLFYYLLSGQWNSMAKYKFESVSITIDSKKHTLKYSDIQGSFRSIDKKILNRLPISMRRRVHELLENSEGDFIEPELEMLCRQFDIPLHYLLRELDLFDRPTGTNKSVKTLKNTLEKIRESLNAQLLYLPTYRRIEQELNLIFKGFDDSDVMRRHKMRAKHNRSVDTYVELVEFGMKDVESAIKNTREGLERFARENLNNLTFGYLGDIVEQQYESVDLKQIKEAEPETINNILNRIQEPILSSQNKQHLREIIDGVKTKTDEAKNVHSQVICHYFTKLMAFHKDLESKEAKIVSFCNACNEYMVDKKFRYDSSNFNFSIQSEGFSDQEIRPEHLSSGEKQIVSLFSHLYLSGGEKYFVLIDEPELSLSVTWQRKFLADIWNADFCSGVVAVTHSPFIYENELKKYAHGIGEFIGQV
jgi:predicted ATP-dependent endonuclease of OLD family